MSEVHGGASARIAPRTDEQVPKFPARTMLYSLGPLGCGTPWVESLSGYLIRLSCEHILRVGDLIGKALSLVESPYGNLLSPAKLRRAATSSHHGFTQYNYAMNGVDGIGERVVYALEAATGIRGLRGLTFLVYRPMLRGFLFHKQRRWCPVCLETWRISNALLYEPLFWTCACAMTCPEHGCALASTCPKCRCTVGPITVSACIGFCDHCGAWLGQASSSAARPCDGTNDEDFWEQSQVLGLISMMPSLLQQSSEGATWQKNLQSLLDGAANGSLNAFAEHVGVDRGTLEGWLAGRCLPLVANALKVVRVLGIDVCCVFGDAPLSRAQLSVARESIATSEIPFHRNERKRQQIRDELEKSLREPVPESLTTIAHRLGLANPSRLYRADRDATSAIAKRFRSSRGGKPVKVFNKRHARQLLIREFRSDMPRSPCKIAAELGFSARTLRFHHPELCRELAARRRETHQLLRARVVRELCCAFEEMPPPSMTQLSARFGHCPQMLARWAPIVCRQIAERWAAAQQNRIAEVGRGLEIALGETPPPSLRELVERLYTNATFIREHHPDLRSKVVRRYREFEVAKKQRREEEIIAAIRRAQTDLQTAGIPPSGRQIRRHLGPVYGVIWDFSVLMKRVRMQ